MRSLSFSASRSSRSTARWRSGSLTSAASVEPSALVAFVEAAKPARAAKPVVAIFAYTRAQALEDGVLVDVTETAKEAGFEVPVALTRAARAPARRCGGVEGQRYLVRAGAYRAVPGAR